MPRPKGSKNKKNTKQLFIKSGHEAHYNMMMKTEDD